MINIINSNSNYILNSILLQPTDNNYGRCKVVSYTGGIYSKSPRYMVLLCKCLEIVRFVRSKRQLSRLPDY